MKNGPILQGIDILRKYIDDNDWNCHAEHDQIWFGPDADDVSEKDKNKLEDLGWFISEDSWAFFT